MNVGKTLKCRTFIWGKLYIINVELWLGLQKNEPRNAGKPYYSTTWMFFCSLYAHLVHTQVKTLLNAKLILTFILCHCSSLC